MMIMLVRYYDRKTDKMVEIKVPSDVLSVIIPKQPTEGLPKLKITVNSDAVIVDQVLPKGQKDKLITMHEYTEMLAEAE